MSKPASSSGRPASSNCFACTGRPALAAACVQQAGNSGFRLTVLEAEFSQRLPEDAVASPRSGTRAAGARPSPTVAGGLGTGVLHGSRCQWPALARSKLWPEGHFGAIIPGKRLRRQLASTTGQIPLPLHFLAVVLDGARRAAVGVHTPQSWVNFCCGGRRLMSTRPGSSSFVGTLLLRLRGCAAGLLCLGGSQGDGLPALRHCGSCCGIAVLIALAVLLGRLSRAGRCGRSASHCGGCGLHHYRPLFARWAGWRFCIAVGMVWAGRRGRRRFFLAEQGRGGLRALTKWGRTSAGRCCRGLRLCGGIALAAGGSCYCYGGCCRVRRECACYHP